MMIKKLLLQSKLKWFVPLLVTLTSCNVASEAEEQDVEGLIRSVEVNRLYAHVYGTGKDAKEVLYLKLDSNSGANLPKEVYLNGIPMIDNGKGWDLAEGDGVYSTPWSRSVANSTTSVENEYYNKFQANQDAKFYIKCSFDVSAPGESCMGQSCPTTSLLGGSTWFCICTSDCEFCWGDCES